MSEGGHRRSRPCSVCRRWFVPDTRVGERQRTCGPACRREQKRRTQAAWSERNPGYWGARRLRAQEARVTARKEAKKPEIPARRPPDALRSIPTEIVQDAIGVKGFVLIQFIVRLMNRMAQDVMRDQVLAITAEIEGLRLHIAQDETDCDPRAG